MQTARYSEWPFLFVSMKEYSLKGGKLGSDRLKTLSSTLACSTESFLEKHVSNFEGLALDLGCGNGSVTRLLSKLGGANAKVYGIDRDLSKVEAARKLGPFDSERIEFKEGDAYKPCTFGPFQIIYARFLLSHLREPKKVLNRISEALNKDGMLLLEDTDFSGHFCFPYSKAFYRYVELYQSLLASRGANANIGPALKLLCEEAGFIELTLEVTQPAHAQGSGKYMAELTFEAIKESLLKEGICGLLEYEHILQELKELRMDEGVVMSLPRIIQVKARKA